MTGTVKVGEGESSIEVPYRFSKRAKLITIRIKNDQTPELVIPHNISLNRALIFLGGKLGWIKQHTKPKHENITLSNGIILPVLGEQLEVVHTGRAAGHTHIKDNKLVVYARQQNVEQNIRDFLERHLKLHVDEIAAIKAEMLGVKFKSIKIKKLGSMWGNCSHDGKLNFSSLLVHTPMLVLEYVVSHEIAHLKEMNHSRRFWKTVEHLMPDYSHARKWLKANTDKVGVYSV